MFSLNEQGRNDICFLIVGDGSELQRLRNKAAALKLNEHIVFAGYVRDEVLLKQYLSSADVCISPEPKSLCNDRMTFIKVLDYMAAGKPIVAFDLPGNQSLRW